MYTVQNAHYTGHRKTKKSTALFLPWIYDKTHFLDYHSISGAEVLARRVKSTANQSICGGLSGIAVGPGEQCLMHVSKCFLVIYMITSLCQ